MWLTDKLAVGGRTKCQRLLTLWAGHGVAAAHLSDFVTVFERIRLAITMAEATRSPLFDRSMDSTGSVPRSWLIWSAWPSILHRRTRALSGIVSGC